MIESELRLPVEWRREGRGLTTEVMNLTADRLRAGIDGLPQGGLPFELLAVEKRSTVNGFVDDVRVVDLVELEERSAAGDWNYFLWSRALTPKLAPWLLTGPPVGQVAPVLAINGLINVQYRRKLKGKELPTRIGCVNRIVSGRGEVFRHAEYEVAYRALTRRLVRSDPRRDT